MTNPIIKGLISGFKPDPRYTVTEWAENFRVLTSESSAESGLYRVSRTPFLKEIMDVMSPTDPTQQVKVIKGTQLGFALSLDTEIATPDGFTTMQNISVGDTVFDESGQTCKVISKSPIFTDHLVYNITFDDGTEVKADADHRWSLNKGILNTKAIYKTFVKNKYAVMNTKPLQPNTNNKLIIPPYFLGIWLGDGKQKGNEIGLHKDDCKHIVKEFKALDIPFRLKFRDDITVVKFGEGVHNICKNGHCGKLDVLGNCTECGDKSATQFRVLRNRLKELGVQEEKHIPNIYLTASHEDRLNLLQGLMDTDGYICKVKGRCGYDSSNYRLAKDVSQLICSLGYKVSFETSKRETNYTNGKLATIYRLRFYATNDIKIFKLPRKQNLVKFKNTRSYMSKQRKIKNIELINTEDVQCITVNSKSHLFLITRSYIPTHNSQAGINIALTFLDYYPSPILYILPTETLAKNTSKRIITPSLRACPHLAKKIIGGKSKADVGEVFTKSVAGGSLQLGWSNSTASFRSFSARVVILDDCDGYGSFGEGDVMELGKARADAFANKKIYINSTPTISGSSNIEVEFDDSDQREYEMPCPECGELMAFKWEYMHYTRDKKGALDGDCLCACPNCGTLIPEYKKTVMMNKGVWIPKNEGHIHKGYKLTSFYSPLGWLSWNEIASEFIKAHKLMLTGDSRLMQVWQNTRNAQAWLPDLDGVDITDAHERVEDYGCEVPEEVLILTCGVDTQDDRFELEVVGHGRNGETWSIDYKVIAGDPQFDETRDALDDYLFGKVFTRKNGATMKISGTGIDTGGHRTKIMYEYCKDRAKNNVFAFKGANQIQAPITNKRVHQMVFNELTLFSIGVTALKDDFYANLSIITEGTNYCHFPNKPVYNDKYFKMLTAEKRDETGRYVKVRLRNEALDVRIYAMAVLAVMDISPNNLPYPVLYTGEQVISKTQVKQTTNIGVSNYLDEF